jgi:hypothetical protein
MDKRNIRIGDWICDASNYNYVLRAGINEIQCAHIFTPLGLTDRFLWNFKIDTIGGEEVFYRNEGSQACSLQDEGGRIWRVSIHTQFMKVEGTIRYVHELQHFLLDCGIYWDICDCGERRL